jgi:hypothetical protein
MLFSGDWRKVIHEKKPEEKISLHCPFKKLYSHKISSTPTISSSVKGRPSLGPYHVKKRKTKMGEEGRQSGYVSLIDGGGGVLKSIITTEKGLVFFSGIVQLFLA